MNSATRLRRQLTLILAVTLGIGIALGRILLALGLESLVSRNAIVFPASYLAFFGCVFIWRKMAPAPVESGASEARAEEPARKQDKPAKENDRDWLNWLYFDFGEATIILVLVVAVICVIVWIFGEAPAIMSEALFDLGLTASLAGALRKRDATPWYVGLLNKTAFAFIVFFISCELLLLFAHKTCPTQPTLAKIIRECWFR